jgi:hypothetical protein
MEEHACSATIPPGALHTLTTGSLFLLGPTENLFFGLHAENQHNNQWETGDF